MDAQKYARQPTGPTTFFQEKMKKGVKKSYAQGCTIRCTRMHRKMHKDAQ